MRTSANLDPRRKRILYRAWHRGTKEMDLVLGGFADARLAELTDLRDELARVATACAGDGRPDCPILERFAGPPEINHT